MAAAQRRGEIRMNTLRLDMRGTGSADTGSGRVRRLLWTLLQMLLVAALVAGVWRAWSGLDAPLTTIRVTGELTAAERDRATELVASFLPAGYLGLDASGLQARLQAESWVDAASVRRRWPETLELRIAPAVAVARWRDDALLSVRGRVIEPLELVGVDSMPRLIGAEHSAQAVMSAFQQVSEVLRPLGMQVQELALDHLGGVRVLTRNGVEILLGVGDRTGRLERVAAVIAHGVEDREAELARLDARYENGIAVAWREGVHASVSGAQLASRSREQSGDSWPIPLPR